MGHSPVELKPDQPGAAGLSVSGMERIDVPRAAAIYVRVFPGRAARLFRTSEHAQCFYTDLLEAVRLRYPETCFVARDADGCVVGFLMLTLPGWGDMASLIRSGWFWRCLSSLFCGRYGLPLGLARLIRPVRSNAPKALRTTCAKSAHVYVVAVAPAYSGLGIGSRLLRQARASCEGQFRHIWLLVDRENAAAIRLYERLGFRIIGQDGTQHRMLWEL